MIVQKTIEEELKTGPDRTLIDLRPWHVKNVLLLGRYRYLAPQPHLPLHRHENRIEICYCARGEQLYQVDGCDYLVKGGDVFLAFPGEPHGTAYNPETRGEMYWLIIERSDQCFMNLPEAQAAYLFDTLLNLPSRHFKGNQVMKSLLDRAIEITRHTNDAESQIRLANTLVDFFLKIIDCSRNVSPLQIAPLWTNLFNYIQENIRQPLSILALAQQVNLSESRFKTLFKKIAGVPPHEYILKKKIELATGLITDQNYAIKKAAEEAGFSSVYHFSNICKRFTGSRPSQYLPQHLHDE